MKYLCLAYGAEAGWKELTEVEQKALLAQDEVIINTGALVAAVETKVATVTAWDGTPKSTTQPYSDLKLPLAGFSIIEADSINEVIELVKDTPCARAKGAIEIRPMMSAN